MNLLENPGIQIWTRYANEFINPGDSTNLLKKLQKTYSDETLSIILVNGKTVASTKKLASDLQNQQLGHWLDSLVPPEKVFQLLSLNKGADDMLRSPQLETWAWYSKAYANLNPYAHKAWRISALPLKSKCSTRG